MNWGKNDFTNTSHFFFSFFFKKRVHKEVGNKKKKHRCMFSLFVWKTFPINVFWQWLHLHRLLSILLFLVVLVNIITPFQQPAFAFIRVLRNLTLLPRTPTVTGNKWCIKKINMPLSSNKLLILYYNNRNPVTTTLPRQSWLHPLPLVPQWQQQPDTR